MAREMSENEFYELQGNSFRGSRYSNFVGGGVTPQGNVSSAATENAASAVGTSADRSDAGQAVTPEQPEISQGLTSTPAVAAPSTSQMVIGAAAPYAGSVIGQTAGSAIGAGSSIGEGLSKGVSALGSSISGIANKVSGGLIGTAPAVTSAAGKSAASTIGGRATSLGNIGSAAGVGFGAAAATLLSGGSLKDAAKSGVSSAVGAYIGQTLIPIPVIGSLVGSFLGSKLGGLFGGKPSGQWQRGRLDLSSGKFEYGGQGGKKYSASNRKATQNALNAAQEYAKQLEAAGYKRDPNAWGYVSVTADNRNGLGIVTPGKDGKKATTKYYGRNSQKFANDMFANIRSIYGVQPTV